MLGILFDSITSRLWVITYSKSACYYLNGQLFTSLNDISLRNVICDVGEFVRGNSQPGFGVFLFNGFSIYKCSKNNIAKTRIKNQAIQQIKQFQDGTMDIVCINGVLRYTPDSIISYHGSGLDSINGKGKWIGETLLLFRYGRIDFYNKTKKGYALKGQIGLDVKKEVLDIILSKSKYYFIIYSSGVYEMDTSLNSIPVKIWSGSANGICNDKNGNIWITTSDDGIYVLKNSDIINYSFLNGLIHDNITSLFREEKSTRLYCGNTFGEVFYLQDNNFTKIYTNRNYEHIRRLTISGNDIWQIDDNIIKFNLSSNQSVYEPHTSGGPKAILKLKNNEKILVGLLSGICEFNLKTGVNKELNFHKRVIEMAQHPDGRVFCGSLDGVYTYVNDSLTHLDGKDPRLQSRVTSLCFTSDSILWIGTPSNGIIAYNGKEIVGHINTTKYPSYIGSICRKVTPGKPGEVWVATNLGIDMIRYHFIDTLLIDNITPLNTNDGLLSDDVNDILVNDSLIYVATSHGLTILNENELTNPAPAPIYISSIRINDADSLIHDGEYNLSYRQNNLKIEYVGIMLPSAGYIRYQYRLLGSGSDKWVTTANTSIEFRSLSAGNYTFEVVVLDKFGNRSKQIARVNFKVRKAFYMTFWFWSVIIVLILTSGFYVIRYRFRRQQAIKSKIIDLEQQALKAQMNPHFIFNCLTAIQHFVNKEDVYSANMYLSNFAKLIRKTLDLSGEQYITLDKEVAYLDNYIQLEKMRFQDQFNYSIKVDADVDAYTALVPPMLLQPIIENAIRHGLRYKDNNNGLLNISFAKQDNIIICRIDDNGIGIKRSKELKTKAHVEYQSKGMKLTESRIAAINMISSRKITMEVKDKYDDTGNPIGTLVVIKLEQ